MMIEPLAVRIYRRYLRGESVLQLAAAFELPLGAVKLRLWQATRLYAQS